VTNPFLSGGRNTTLFLIAAILIGSLIGVKAPAIGEAAGGHVDPLILGLVFLLFFELRLAPIVRATRHLRFLSIAWVANFLLIPAIGWGVASLFLSGQPLLYTGLLIYFMAPCTDWFLGFTRLAKGDTALGSVLLPVNLISQLLLFPVYLTLFAGANTAVDFAGIASSLWQWFVIPFAAGLGGHQILRRILPPRGFEGVLKTVGFLVPCVLAVLVGCIFAANITTILSHAPAFARILAAVFVFFIITWYLGEFLSRRFRLAQPERVLLTMTTAARNAPLMLGLTTAVMPDQPLVHAAIIIGMLVEFPHLTALSHLLLREKPHDNSQQPEAETVVSLTNP
jgi:ACR3 family arsenite efflux pump ArsB